MRLQRLLAVLAVPITISCAPRPRPALRPWTARTAFDPGTLVFHGNAVRGDVPLELIRVSMLRRHDSYGLAVLRSRDDGATWSMSGWVTPATAGTLYDPVTARWRGVLVCAAHADGMLRFFISPDDGDHWHLVQQLRPPRGEMYAEAYLRVVPTGGGSDSTLLLLYASVDPALKRARYELRSTKALDQPWGAPLVVGIGHGVVDGVRASIGRPDSLSRAVVVFSTRDGGSDSADVTAALVDVRRMTTVGPAAEVVHMHATHAGIGLFPLVLRCAGHQYVLYSAWHAGGGAAYARPLSIADDRVVSAGNEVMLYRANGTPNGFGRIWLDESWRGNPQASFVLVSAPRYSTISRTRGESLSTCEE